MSPPRRSQSALEYMMTYGWAILVIVIVAGVLYSLGIFSPSSSLSTTITGFSGLSVTQAGCVNSVNNQILELYVTNTVGYPVNITKINTTGNNGVDASQNISSILGDGDSAVFYVNGACNKSSSYAGSVTITYTEPGQSLPGPYVSTGKVTNVQVHTNSNLVPSFSNNGYISTSSTSVFPSGSSSRTEIAWVYTGVGSQYAGVAYYGMAVGGGGGNSAPYFDNYSGLLDWNSGDSYFVGNYNDYLYSSSSIPLDGWEFLAYNYSGGTLMTVWLNGQKSTGTLSSNVPLDTAKNSFLTIGEWSGSYFNGKIANVQIYDRSLSNAQILQLYSGGVGGAPIPNAGLIGWWPLDGNANDYSGNNNNGVATNVNWVSP